MLRPAHLVCLLLVALLGNCPVEAAPPWKHAYRAHRDQIRANLQLQQARCQYPPAIQLAHQLQLRQHERHLRQAYRATGQGLPPHMWGQPVPSAMAAVMPVHAVPVMAPRAYVVSPMVVRSGATTVIQAQHEVPQPPTTTTRQVAPVADLVPIPQAAPAPAQPASGTADPHPTPAQRPSGS